MHLSYGKPVRAAGPSSWSTVSRCCRVGPCLNAPIPPVKLVINGLPYQMKGTWRLSRACWHHCPCPPLTQTQAVPASWSLGLDPDPWLRQRPAAAWPCMPVLVLTGVDPALSVAFGTVPTRALLGCGCVEPMPTASSGPATRDSAPAPPHFALPLIPRDKVSVDNTSLMSS